MRSVCVDATFVRAGAVGGAQQMLENLLEGLCVAAAAGERIVAIGAPTGRLISVREPLQWMPPPPGGNRFVKSTRILRRYARDHDAILFPNYFTPPIRSAGARIGTVIHDLQYLAYPDTFSRVKRGWLRAAHLLTLRVADVVVTVTEHVRADLLDRYGRRWERKVISIPNAISWERFDQDSTQEPAGGVARSRRYVLAVSAQYPHKNLATLIEAFAILQQQARYRDVDLVMVGQWSSRLVGIAKVVDLRAQVERLGLQDRVTFTGYIEDAAVGALYRGANVFVFPSVFEGFGMPAVEALGFGLPVLTTRCSAIPESTLGLATYVDDPLDAHEMATAMSAILDNPSRFTPSHDSVALIRDTYSLARIGGLYRQALLGEAIH